MNTIIENPLTTHAKWSLHQALGGLTALAPLGDGSAFVVGYPVHCRVFCRIAGHHPLYPSGTPP